MITEIRVTDWDSLNKELFDKTWNSTINRFRSTFAYRGLSVEGYELTNSLCRLGKPYPNMERNLIKQFKKYAHGHVIERNNEWHWLSIAQHHGLPTRLMDWTYSPLIALHFATDDLSHYAEDGAIWKVNYAQAHSLLPNELTKSLDKLGASIFSVEALRESIEDLDQMDAKHAKNFDIAVFFEPPSLDDRIINQFAYFSVLSDPYISMDVWLNRPDVAKHVDAVKIVIPKTLKWEVRDKLDQSNINERVLMPGLDGLCAWLRRHYKAV